MKNYSDPRMHTVEHILNGTMVKLFDSPRCFSSHIEKKLSKCDYRFRQLEENEVRELEQRVNEVIERDLSITEEFTTKEEAEKLCTMTRVPYSTGNDIRLVKVGDYDICPCIGSHVKKTKEIGTFKITTWSHQDGILRIRFKVDA